MLLCPRDYLSTFMKIGTILLLALGILRRAAAAPDAGRHAVRRRHRAGLRRQALPVRLHHHRLRRDQRIPRARRVRHDAQDAHARERRAPHRLRRDADGVVRGGDGDVRRLRARSRRLLRHQRAARHARRHAGGRGRGDPHLGIHRHARADHRGSPPTSARRRCSAAPAARRRSRSAWRTSSAARSARD